MNRDRGPRERFDYFKIFLKHYLLPLGYLLYARPYVKSFHILTPKITNYFYQTFLLHATKFRHLRHIQVQLPR